MKPGQEDVAGRGEGRGGLGSGVCMEWRCEKKKSKKVQTRKKLSPIQLNNKEILAGWLDGWIDR